MEKQDPGNTTEFSGQSAQQANVRKEETDIYDIAAREEALLKRLQERLIETKKKIRNWLHIMG